MLDTSRNALLAIDLASGERAIVSDEQNGAGVLWSEPNSVAWDLENNRALVVDTDYPTRLFAVDLSTGERMVAAESLGETGLKDAQSTTIWDASKNRVLVAMADPVRMRYGEVMSVDLLTGQSTTIADYYGTTGVRIYAPLGMTWDPKRNRVIILDGYDLRWWAIDVDTKEATELAPSVEASEAVPMAWDSARNRVLVLDRWLDALIAVDVATGEQTAISNASTGAGPSLAGARSMSWDAERNQVLVSNPDLHALMAIDVETGDRVLISR